MIADVRKPARRIWAHANTETRNTAMFALMSSCELSHKLNFQPERRLCHHLLLQLRLSEHLPEQCRSDPAMDMISVVETS